MAVDVEDPGVGAVFGFMDASHIDSEKWVREPRVGKGCGVGEENGDKERAEGEWDVEAEGAEAGVDVPRVDDAVVVAIPEEDVGLEGREAGM